MIRGMAANLSYLILGFCTLLCSLLCTRGVRRAFSRFRSRELKAGKELIYRHFPKHKKPLGGGVAMFLALLGGGGLATILQMTGVITGVALGPLWLWLLCGMAFGAVGFIDDWRKVHAAKGLSEWGKMALLFGLATLFTLWIISVREIPGQAPNALFLPFIGWVSWPWLFLPVGIFVLVGASNAVNLTDGLDGLAGSGLLIAFGGYLLLGGVLQHERVPVLLPLLAVASLLGFLYFNRPTAKIIMGDTGALGFGAALGALALLSGTEWLLVLLAAPFVIDTLSVLIQVSVIKFFRGPFKLLRHQTTEIFRPFLCTPLHHHFQWLTWGPWPILGLFAGVAVLSVVLALLAFPAESGSMGAGWFWWGGLVVQAGVLLFAALQKIVRANYFLGLGKAAGQSERMLTLYKGLPMEVLGVPWYHLEEVTGISESMVNTLAAESILWRNISEIEARATLGKIYAEYKQFDRAAHEWEEIPLRNLLIRETLVVQLGKIYFTRDELMRAVKLWEHLPPARLAALPGLLETIQSAKVRVGHLASRLYHQALEHVGTLRARVAGGGRPEHAQALALIAEMEGALRYTQDLRDLLAYEQRKAEVNGELDGAETEAALYRRMDGVLAARREELHGHLEWAQALLAPADTATTSSLEQLAGVLRLTPAEVCRALEVAGTLPIRGFAKLTKPSRNNIYRITLERAGPSLSERFIAKSYVDAQVAFFAACYRRERGVLQLLQEVEAPTPRVLGGHLGSHQAVLFLEDLGPQDLAAALAACAPEDRQTRLALLCQAIDCLVHLRLLTLPILPRLSREIEKIVKEVLTPEYYVNTTTIALNRILALDRRQLSAAERGGLELALQPLITPLLDEPRIFIHFEFTPGNLHLTDRRVMAMDFEQATMGPAAFDLATLLLSPDADLTDEELAALLDYYHESLPAAALPLLAVQPAALAPAAIMKLLFYAGSAANFYRKFEEGTRLTAMEWYLQSADRLLWRTPAYHELGHLLRACWHGQMHLQV
jgi:phospho-N-acetylmuramoyl-pentapeptide-transferase